MQNQEMVPKRRDLEEGREHEVLELVIERTICYMESESASRVVSCIVVDTKKHVDMSVYVKRYFVKSSIVSGPTRPLCAIQALNITQ